MIALARIAMDQDPEMKVENMQWNEKKGNSEAKTTRTQTEFQNSNWNILKW